MKQKKGSVTSKTGPVGLGAAKGMKESRDSLRDLRGSIKQTNPHSRDRGGVPERAKRKGQKIYLKK